MSSTRQFLLSSFLCLPFLLVWSSPANADSLTITYNGDQNQTATVQLTAFATVVFTGSVTNNSNQPVTFQLLGGPNPPSPYVASFQSGIPFPGITLAPSGMPGSTTGIIDLAIVMINPFDPSLPYPGLVNIVFPAVDPHTGMTLSGSSGNTATILVVNTPEPSSIILLAISLLGLVALSHMSRSTSPSRLRTRI